MGPTGREDWGQIVSVLVLVHQAPNYGARMDELSAIGYFFPDYQHHFLLKMGYNGRFEPQNSKFWAKTG